MLIENIRLSSSPIIPKYSVIPAYSTYVNPENRSPNNHSLVSYLICLRSRLVELQKQLVEYRKSYHEEHHYIIFCKEMITQQRQDIHRMEEKFV